MCVYTLCTRAILAVCHGGTFSRRLEIINSSRRARPQLAEFLCIGEFAPEAIKTLRARRVVMELESVNGRSRCSC